jgi:hypothetical protein
MTGDRFIRNTLWGAAAYNIAGAWLFAFPASYLGRLSGLPADVPPVYKFLLALLVFGFGCAYLWLARQKSVSRPFILFVAIDKFCVFLVMFVLWLVHEAMLRSVAVISGDLVFSVLWMFWLLRTRQSSPGER